MGNPLDLNRLMWLGAGAGSKGIAAGIVSGMAPEAGIAPEVAAAAIGFWLATQEGKRISPFGEGLLIASIGQLVRKPIEGIFGKLGQGGTTPTPEEAAAATKAAATKPQGSPEESLDAYLAAKYGIA